MKYDVGQIIQVVFAKQATIVPCLIVEENVKKTLEGQKTEYKAILAIEPNVVVELSRIDGSDGKIFATLDEATEYLSKKFLTYVNAQKNKAIKLASMWDKYQKPAADPTHESSEQSANDGYVIAVLPDGTEARVKLPNISISQTSTQIPDENV